MGDFDTFYDENSKIEAQLKCFDCEFLDYCVGDLVPVEQFGFPKSCTFADIGGRSKKFFEPHLIDKQFYGNFVIIQEGRLKRISYRNSDIIHPVFTKFGDRISIKKKVGPTKPRERMGGVGRIRKKI